MVVGRPASGAHCKRSSRTESAITEMIWPTYKVPCANSQAVLLAPHAWRRSGRARDSGSETKKTSTCSNSHKEERLRHAFPSHCRDKE
jgi:hypothetical protein